jgi:hypothetical protein
MPVTIGLTDKIYRGKMYTTAQENRQMEPSLYQEIGTQTSVDIIKDFLRDSPNGKLEQRLTANHYVWAEDKLLIGTEVSLRYDQCETLIAHADRILFWHYDFKPDCVRIIDIKIGNATYSIPVTRRA